jgi:hypothetical protein
MAQLISSSNGSLIAFNTNQLQQLTPSNFPSWSVTFKSLLHGFDLMGYFDGTTKCPLVPPNSTEPGTNTTAILWFRQDQLLLNVILALISDNISPLIATAKTSVEDWSRLIQLYANRSRTRVMQLKESLTLLQKGDQSIFNYMQVVRTIVDELAMIDTPLSNDDITLYVLNGLGTNYKDIIAPIRTRETSLTFEELHDILTAHETHLKRIEATQSQLMATANNTQRSTVHYYQRQPRNYQRGNLQQP